MQVPSLGWEDPLKNEMAPTPVFLPGESHGQKSLMAYSPKGQKKLDLAERLSMHLGQFPESFSGFCFFIIFTN